MTVYVDALIQWPAPRNQQTRKAGAKHGHRWCHLFSDAADLTELHDMAKAIGMRPEWFQDKKHLPHYDLTPLRRAHAIRFGAIECDRYRVVEVIHRGARQL